METVVKKVDNDGNVGVRDYIVRQAIEKKDVLHINLENTEETMSKDPQTLISKRVKKTGPYQSKHKEDDWYYVWWYKWEPNLVPND